MEENKNIVNNESGESSNFLSLEEVKTLKEQLIIEKQKAQHILNLLKTFTVNSESYELLFEGIRKNIEKSKEDIALSYNQIKTTKTLNTKLYNELLLQEKRIKESLEITRWYINDSKNIKNNISVLEKKLLKREENSKKVQEKIDQLKIQSNGLKNDIVDASKKMQLLLKNWKVLIEGLKNDKALSKEMISYIKTVNEETKKNQSEIQALLNKGKTSFKFIEEKERQISQIYSEVSTKQNKISSWYEKLFNTGWMKDEINKIKLKIKENQFLIDQQLSETSANRLTITLKSKLEKTEKELYFWRKSIILVVISLVILNFALYILWYLYEQYKLNYLEYIEFSYPLIFLLVFFVLQYSKINKFYEEYYFKYIAAFWLPAYFELLESKDDTKAVGYLIQTIENIHLNPTKEINSSTKDTVFDYILDGIKSLFWASKGVFDFNKIIKSLTKEQAWEILDFIKWKL